MKTPAAAPRPESLRIRLSSTEKAALQSKAGAAGLSVSAYIRKVCGLKGEK